MLAITFVHDTLPVEREDTLSVESLRAEKARSVAIYQNTSLPLNLTNSRQGFHLLVFTASPGAEAAAQPKLPGPLQMAKTLKSVELIHPPNPCCFNTSGHDLNCI